MSEPLFVRKAELGAEKGQHGKLWVLAVPQAAGLAAADVYANGFRL